MARKTTKAALDAIHRFECAVAHAEDILKTRAKWPEENWTDHTKKWTPEFIEVYMYGFMAATEAVLHDQKCYAGYHHLDATGNYLIQREEDEWITDHPEYRYWRIRYHTRGV